MYINNKKQKLKSSGLWLAITLTASSLVACTEESSVDSGEFTVEHVAENIPDEYLFATWGSLIPKWSYGQFLPNFPITAAFGEWYPELEDPENWTMYGRSIEPVYRSWLIRLADNPAFTRPMENAYFQPADDAAVTSLNGMAYYRAFDFPNFSRNSDAQKKVAFQIIDDMVHAIIVERWTQSASGLTNKKEAAHVAVINLENGETITESPVALPDDVDRDLYPVAVDDENVYFYQSTQGRSFGGFFGENDPTFDAEMYPYGVGARDNRMIIVSKSQGEVVSDFTFESVGEEPSFSLHNGEAKVYYSDQAGASYSHNILSDAKEEIVRDFHVSHWRATSEGVFAVGYRKNDWLEYQERRSGFDKVDSDYRVRPSIVREWNPGEIITAETAIPAASESKDMQVRLGANDVVTIVSKHLFSSETGLVVLDLDSGEEVFAESGDNLGNQKINLASADDQYLLVIDSGGGGSVTDLSTGNTVEEVNNLLPVDTLQGKSLKRKPSSFEYDENYIELE
ncbi:hypothetical protein [Corynebacterium cystitidis]|uniref:Uncharacterized protein n=1 Tax=Corynebacterium cystitidis DSM 20524 TaxID=1121357 RepID=A0A1H9TWB5_9CORY|nr:hypothetical protein [Corynebacterium cystitidis]WJY81921.1 hypothetical protein CCYS_04890 [Corynebacterium cystitidis DSM 20524]SES01342.1 hypothetical protein SAMN05661109_01584 [Corynebacterium cystitidis DSM 20524]SNV81999.1 Uncharacterised protein [Corynebacterium cystitidis]